MAYETLIVEIEDDTALIRLNRPDALNALNTKLMQELATALTAWRTLPHMEPTRTLFLCK